MSDLPACYNPHGKNEHGGPWAQLGVRNTQKCSHTNIPKRSSPKRASSVLMPDVITIPWFELASSHRPWNTSSRSSAG